MTNLATKYLGLELNTPLVVSSNPLCRDIENLKCMEELGAGAVVLPSLFEEQITLQNRQMSSQDSVANLPPANGRIGLRANRVLNIIIQVKLVGMRSQFDIVDFIFGFVFDPHIDGILGEHIAF